MSNPTVIAIDELGVVHAAELWNQRPVRVTYENSWPSHAAFEAGRQGKLHGGTAAANLRTVSKGSSRGAGPQKKQGRVYVRGGAADAVELCVHGNRAAYCENCETWHCGCPGSPKHECEELPWL